MSKVVVENLRSAVYASYEELSAQVQADSALDTKLLGLLGFLAAARVQHMEKLPPAPLPEPSGIPSRSVPTGPSLNGLVRLLRRRHKSHPAAATVSDSPVAAPERD